MLWVLIRSAIWRNIYGAVEPQGLQKGNFMTTL